MPRTRAARWHARALAGLTASALVLPLVAVPQVRDLALREVALAVDLAGPEARTRAYVQQQTAQTRMAPAPVLVWGDSILEPSGPTAGGRGLPPVAAPPRPSPPAPPALRPIRRRATPPQPAPVVRLGPVLRMQRQVARGESVTLPAGVGNAHILCDRAGGQRAQYWLDSSGGATEVHRRDGSGSYDFSYRWVDGGSYQQRDACR